MGTDINKLLTRVYEIEGILLVLRRKHNDVPPQLVDKLKSLASSLIVEVDELVNLSASNATAPHNSMTGDTADKTVEIKPKTVAHAQSEPMVAPPPFQQAKRDILSAFTINDRFLFQRELFNGDVQAFNDVIAQLQSLSTIDQVNDFLVKKMGWNLNNEVEQDFVRLVSHSFK